MAVEDPEGVPIRLPAEEKIMQSCVFEFSRFIVSFEGRFVLVKIMFCSAPTSIFEYYKA